MHPYHRRLVKEYQAISKANLPGVELVSSEELQSFLFKIHIDNHELYPDDYYLQVTITDDYPVDSPSVVFINYASSPIPLHPHIYSNGHICLNLLGEDWTPACSIESILLSIQSMLHSNQLAERPPDDAQYVKGAPRDPKRTNFVYHDDNI
ncbi:hypothetical protein KGF57_003431 [Candida theae]|uniref:UBC core domain-containing protein n=1 Tax=Candida theae TaxID=1198502 RepID=A0AAD5FY18_9ASCO|nr:uncharacterized protein KGF57_003431 [Candida theae]KAI5956624.1 hypothetical protein KGF57_003431 [Candida theae]